MLSRFVWALSKPREIPKYKYCGCILMSTVIVMTWLLEAFMSHLGIVTAIGFNQTDDYNPVMVAWGIAFAVSNIIAVLTGLHASWFKFRCGWIISLAASVIVFLLQTIIIVMALIHISSEADPTIIRTLIFFGTSYVLLLFGIYNLQKLIQGKYYQNSELFADVAPSLAIMSQIFVCTFIILSGSKSVHDMLDFSNKDWTDTESLLHLSCMLSLIMGGTSIIIGFIVNFVCNKKKLIYRLLGIFCILGTQFMVAVAALVTYWMIFGYVDIVGCDIWMHYFVLCLMLFTIYKLQLFMNRNYKDGYLLTIYGLSAAFLLWPITVVYALCLKFNCSKTRVIKSIFVTMGVSIFIGFVCYVCIIVYWVKCVES